MRFPRRDVSAVKILGRQKMGFRHIGGKYGLRWMVGACNKCWVGWLVGWSVVQGFEDVSKWRLFQRMGSRNSSMFQHFLGCKPLKYWVILPQEPTKRLKSLILECFNQASN